MCAAVLCNAQNAPLVSLDSMSAYGAMLGNVGIRIPIADGAEQPASETEQVFLQGGKMIKYGQERRRLEPMNTTISAIVAVSSVAVGQRNIGIEIELWERALGKRPSFAEVWNFVHERHEQDRAARRRAPGVGRGFRETGLQGRRNMPFLAASAAR